MTFDEWFQAEHPVIPIRSAHAVLRLAEEGGTVPFIARYRKEQTQNLDEVAIQKVIDGKERWDGILKRQSFILAEIESQGKLTPELREKLSNTYQWALLEDLYLPYKQKKKTKAVLAKEAGLEPFADWVWNCGHGTEKPLEGQTLEIWAFTFRNEEKGIKDVAAVVQGALDILIERLSETRTLREAVREAAFTKGCLRSEKAEKAKTPSKFENYFDYREPVESLKKPQNSHRYLAMRRGMLENELLLSIAGAPDDAEWESRLLSKFEVEACTVIDSPGADLLKKAARLSFKAYVLPSIDTEVHRSIKEVADEAAIGVFANNMRKLLLSAPFGSKAVLGVDPGIRTGCKLALIDDSGKYLENAVMMLQTDEQKAQSKALLLSIFAKLTLQAVAVGNGTAGREAELFVRSVVKEAGLSIPVVMVSEAGASVYSASEEAREEFADLDLTIRGAITIARRLQDPLAELVKTDPKSIGVGQYQHDVHPNLLKKSLEFVVDSCVNSVGVNLNTASYQLLSHVAGIGPALGKAIVVHRAEKGLFKSRAELLEVPRFSTKAFEQAAGFLRIPGAENVLDNTGVHPERYPMLEKLAAQQQKTVKDFVGGGASLVKADPTFQQEVGPFTFKDIVSELEKPGRDPRESFVPFSFREDIHKLEDVQAGMVCPGLVSNVTNFGAFVDIGVHQDGLVHISQLSDKFVKDPKDIVSPGDRVQVKVLEVNMEKRLLSLTIKGAAPKVERPAPPPRVASSQRPVGQHAGGPRNDHRNGPRGGGGQHRGGGAPQGGTPRGGGGGGGQQRGGARPRDNRPPKPQFKHNPFAALVALKTTSKPDNK